MKRKNQDEQIRFLNEMLNNLPVALFCKDVTNGYRNVFWNATSEKLFGFTQEQVVGKTDFDLYPHEVAAFFRSKDEETIATKAKVFIPEEAIQKKGELKKTWLRTWKVPICDEQGNPIYLLGIAQDISELKQYEEAKNESEKKLESISAHAPGMFYQYFLNPDGKNGFSYVSRGAFEIFGLYPEIFINSPDVFVNSILEEDRKSYDSSIEGTVELLNPWRWQGRVRHVRGDVRWIKCAAEPRRLEDGTTLWDGMIMDVTAQKEVEEIIRRQEIQLAESSRLASLGEMAGSLAHEINTPLGSILFCTELIREALSVQQIDREALQEKVDLVENTTLHVSKLIRSLKTFLRDGSRDPVEPLTVQTIFDHTMNLCSQKLKQSAIKISVVIEPPELAVQCRMIQLGQVLLNLLGNSCDAIVGPEKWIRVEAHQAGEFVELSVTDSGPPIPPEIRRHMFEPYFTSKEVGKGTGLGLTISSAIIHDNGGQLFLDDESPNTRFVIRLPIALDKTHVA